MVLIILRKNTCKINFPNAEESASYNFSMLDSPNKKRKAIIPILQKRKAPCSDNKQHNLGTLKTWNLGTAPKVCFDPNMKLVVICARAVDPGDSWSFHSF